MSEELEGRRSRTRLFVAAWASGDVRERAREAEEALRARGLALRFAERAQLHATLVFIGTVPDLRVAEIEGACAGVASSGRPMDVLIDRLGAFPSERRAAVVWLGADRETDGFRGVVEELRARLGAMGFDLDEKEAVPHVTIARAKFPVELPDVPIAATRWRIDEISLVESRTLPTGPKYATLRSWRLGSET